jgi:glycerol-3-phosphate dehydrogenase (NAD(P)+)
VGEKLGKGHKLDDILGGMQMVAEGLNTAVLVLELADRHGVEMPICEVIDRVVRGELAPADAYFGLTPAGHEADPG